jgi:hypothetical protein
MIMRAAVLVTAAVALLVGATHAIHNRAASGQVSEAQAAAVYVAQVVAVDSSSREAFVAWLRHSRLPIWHQLRREGYLRSQSVFEATRVVSTQAGVPSWRYLLLTRVGKGKSAAAFLRAQSQRAEARDRRGRGVDSAGSRVRRVEILRSTPNSFYPTPEPGHRPSDMPTFLIEYIAVRDSAPLLAEYRESMRRNSGPALGALVKAGRVYSFIALETVAVTYAEPGMATWNQIHIGGALPSLDEFDSVLKKLNPASGGYRRIFARLDSIRVHTRVDDARELVPLRVQ